MGIDKSKKDGISRPFLLCGVRSRTDDKDQKYRGLRAAFFEMFCRKLP